MLPETLIFRCCSLGYNYNCHWSFSSYTNNESAGDSDADDLKNLEEVT